MKHTTKLNSLAKGIARLVAVSSISAGLAVYAANQPATPSKVTSAQPSAEKTAPGDSLPNRDDLFFNEMQQFERHINSMFNQAWEGTNQIGLNPSFDSSVKLTKEPHQYVVRFALPEKEVANARVTVDNGTLHLTSSCEARLPATTGAQAEKDKGKTTEPEAIDVEHYEQLISLPGPVDNSKMKIQRGDGVLTVTLPKKEESTPAKPANG
jgi:HSP20 family molecular chaperone IbpA